MKSIQNFVISRVKISKASIKVNDLYFTYNGESLQEDLADVVKFIKKSIKDISDLDGATVTTLVHLFNGDEVKTAYFMVAVSLLDSINDKKFSLEYSSKRGHYLTMSTIANVAEEPNDENTEPESGVNDNSQPNSNEETKEEQSAKNLSQEDQSAKNLSQEDQSESAEEQGNVSDEQPAVDENDVAQEDDKKKSKDKKKAVKDATSKL